MSSETLAAGGAAPSVERQRRKAGKGAAKQLLGILGIIGFLATWELIPRLGLIDERFLPPASEVIAALVVDFGLTAFWVAVGETMKAWFLGLLMAVAAAVLLGFIIGSSEFLRKATNSTIEFLRPIPSVALIPLAVLLFGVKIESSLLLIVYASFWQVLIQVLYGVADVDMVANNTARTYGLGRMARIRYVVFPTALPYLMTGVRLAAAVALVLAITAELVIGSPGLGREIALAQSGGAISGMYALVLATGLIGVLINMLMRQIEKRILGWHSSIRSEVIV
ncbi:ABC transporter permease [Arthrobacter sp. KFRI-F3372]|uniref:ABC-type nitrate/sulfonate/bicarbonate transport system permease component n=1 Tax=Pseudarthrobacter oxydans TaxID=1671 RepID=A0AAW8N4Y1_PSEOX|nr:MULTISPECIES: ABC transporter permease [Pseudarthrobacter]WHP58316.1 ABC transporter permease [Arthrobacter sp. KFRI-F3372]MDR6791090.1 ABC-type nitrate/sulfonate/bicarbonate transport system permease component [Pseudarthrobacter oxydans]MDR7162481.1 ABC-type nitrate/sulfonate/bicarbonate transport system permease component [Pseudarthrobacter oxydans]NSX38604.1 ABC transporter permease [Pseudarthrobacter oxydans]GKV72199.1 nitrate ABC transporter permease [Pseudarthrobacter sp. NCCP-2145]